MLPHRHTWRINKIKTSFHNWLLGNIIYTCTGYRAKGRDHVIFVGGGEGSGRGSDNIFGFSWDQLFFFFGGGSYSITIQVVLLDLPLNTYSQEIWSPSRCINKSDGRRTIFTLSTKWMACREVQCFPKLVTG